MPNRVSQTSSKRFVETPSICLFWWLGYVPFSVLRFLSTLWPILEDIAHHIQDKLAISFDSSSIGLISYKWFLTIYDKYSSVNTYNEEDSIF